ncbi:HD domain-containing phosphohydrolase [Pseudoalteromonas sp. YIC-656]|uniref:HD domain-containing phosphohydrolase n=1 Tax=Pseudoalteromonas pernae TaxID=3118054 RepID=UPI003241DC12
MQSNLMPERFSIRFTIVSLFVFVVLFVAFATIATGYYFDVKHARQAANDQFIHIAHRSKEKIEHMERMGTSLVKSLKYDATIVKAINEQPHDVVVSHFTERMNTNDHLFSLFAGHRDGAYIEVSNLDATAGVRQAWQAKENERWVVNYITVHDGGRIQKRDYLDNALNVTRSQVNGTGFEVNTRPWFTSAKLQAVTSSAPYQLSMVELTGFSFTLGLDDNVVVGASMLLSSLDQLLVNNHYPLTSRAIIFNSNGLLLAQHGGKDHERTAPHQVLMDLANDPSKFQSLLEVKIAGQDYFAFIEPLKMTANSNSNEFIGLAVSRSEVLAPYTERSLVAVGVSILVALLMLPVVLVSGRLIVNPMRELAKQNVRVQKRQYQSVKHIKSRIVEINDLSASLVSMSTSICDYQQAQKDLLDSFIKLIAQAIDDKSPYTGGHCERVPKIAITLAQAAQQSRDPVFKSIKFDTEEQWREFKIAAWLHDCGKITTPEHIVDKGTKLEAIYNRIHEIRMRFEVLLRDAEIRCLQGCLDAPHKQQDLHQVLAQEQAQIRDDFAFVAACNVGGEFMSDAHLARLKSIAEQTWMRYLDDRLGLSPMENQTLSKMATASEPSVPRVEHVLADKPEHIRIRENSTSRFEGFGFTMTAPEVEQNLGEVYNLSIGRGTLTEEDRYIIQEHISSTIKMLETLPLPPELSRVPEYAGAHHEKLDGTGYPRGLDESQLSMPARIMALADVFEALTASDRPYKSAKTLSESLKIMRFMVLDKHLDKDLFKLFISEGVYQQYAQEFLDPSQWDEVDKDQILAGL